MTKWTKEQLDAIQKSGTNIIVSAGAGSGKTAVLTERVIEKLKSGIHINELLVLTFTKAAAEEMKDRIRKSISEEETLKEELEYIDSSYITTFDSFALSVVKKYHYKLNINHDIKISDSTIILMKKKEIIDEIFDNYYEIKESNFSKLIYDFCVKDDKEIKKSIIDIADKIELLPERTDYLDIYLKTFGSEDYLKNIINDYEKLLLEKKEEIFASLNNLSYVSSKDYFDKVVLLLEPLRNASKIDEIISIKITLPQAPRGSEEEFKKAKEDLNKRVKELNEYSIYGNTEEIKKNILLMKDNITVIINIIKEYFAKLDTYKKENEIYDFQDIALLAIDLIRNNKDVQEELKSSFKEIMVDEYQDTNNIQETFISLISDNNVYVVGDIKQSIYRFRNANPNIFKSKYDNYAKNNGGIKIDLLNNFRSRREVLENINLMFRYLMDDDIGGANYLESHQMEFGNTSYEEEGHSSQDYNMEFFEYPKDSGYRNEEVEIFTIGNDILNKIKNKYQIFDKKSKTLHDANYNDFVILIDRSTSFDLYKKIFEYLGIPLAIYQDKKMSDGYDLDVIKSLIDLTIHIHDKNFDKKFEYDFVSIARSYLYRLDDNEIFNYFLNKNFKDSVIYNDLLEIAETIDNKTTYQILSSLIEKTNMYEKLTTTDDIDNSIIKITKLLEMSQNLAINGYDIFSFNDYIETLIEDKYELKYSVDMSDSNAVRIMTIHKSKGLEYNVCYFSGLDKSFSIQDIKDKFIHSNRYGIITPIFDEGIKETVIKALIKDQYYMEEIAEKIRLLYVAVTRAKEKMIFVLPESDYTEAYKNDNGVIQNSIRKRYRSFADMIISIKKELNKYFSKIDIAGLNISRDYLYNRESEFCTKEKTSLDVKEISIPNEDIEQSSFSKKLYDIIEEEQHSNIELGLNIHETLELLDFKNPNLELISDEFIKEKVTKFLASDLLKNIQGATIYKEYEFMYQEEDNLKHGIIDLMIEYENHIDIIDYKLSNILDDKYLVQLDGYRNYIKQISNKEIHIYLYSIIGEKIKEII